MNSTELKPNFDLKALAKQAEMFPKAGARALNKVMKSAKVQEAKDIRSIYRMKAADVKETITVRKASWSKLRAGLVTTGKRIALYLFNAKQNRRGVAVTITKGGRKTITGAFIATMKSGHVGVFTRKGNKRNPIGEKYTISAPEMAGGKQMTDKTNAFVAANLGKTLDHEIKFYKSQQGAD
jgi:hypothetical protein